MIHLDYSRRIDEFEKVLQKVEMDITTFEHLPPMDLWSQTETSVTILKDLAGNFKEAMLIMKPEKTPVIEQLFKAVIQPLNAFKEILFQETTDPSVNSRLALEQLRKAKVGGSDFLALTKEIRDNPSPIIKEILKLREAYGAKEYLATVQAPKAFQERLNSLIEHIETLSASISSLERELNVIKEHLSNVREESLKFRPAPTGAQVKEPEDAPVTETKKRRFLQEL